MDPDESPGLFDNMPTIRSVQPGTVTVDPGADGDEQDREVGELPWKPRGTMSGGDWLRILKNAALFAGDDLTNPMYSAVHLTATENQIVAVATDRFVLGLARADYVGVPFSVTLRIDDVHTLARLAKPKGKQYGEVMIGVGDDDKAEFDASCYRVIFAAEKPNTDFLSVGNSDDVTSDRLGAGQAIQAVNSGTRIIRVVDRDLMDAAEIEEMTTNGIRVLSRRHIESFLLDDEVLQALCDSVGQSALGADLIAAKTSALDASIARGNDEDDLKSIGGEMFNQARQRLSLSQPGSNWPAFAKGKLAPLLRAGMAPYDDLHRDIFG